MTSTDARARTPSVSELQAALLAARQGAFAARPATDTAEETPAVTASPDAGPVPLGACPPATAEGQHKGRWLLGVHGGSGARRLASVLSGARLSDGNWPAPDAGRGQVVLVCRSSQSGLTAAQDYARQFRDGDMHQRIDLLGVIVSADAPGRLPPPLRRFQRLLSGAVPILGEVPWLPEWRLGPPQPFSEPPVWLSKLEQSIAAAVPR